MENVIDIYTGGVGASLPDAPPADPVSAPAASAVVWAQPATPDRNSYDDSPFDTEWPPYTAWWMLGGDSD